MQSLDAHIHVYLIRKASSGGPVIYEIIEEKDNIYQTTGRIGRIMDGRESLIWSAPIRCVGDALCGVDMPSVGEAHAGFGRPQFIIDVIDICRHSAVGAPVGWECVYFTIDGHAL